MNETSYCTCGIWVGHDEAQIEKHMNLIVTYSTGADGIAEATEHFMGQYLQLADTVNDARD